MGKTGLIKAGAVLGALGVLGALAGCATYPAAPIDDRPALPPAPSTCGAENHAALIGLTRAQAEAANIPGPHRIYGPGDAVTMDFRPDRLNVEIGENGRVIRLSCS